MKHLRPNAGIRDLPNGPEMYQGFLEYYTSKTNITPGKSTEDYKFNQFMIHCFLNLFVIFFTEVIRQKYKLQWQIIQC